MGTTRCRGVRQRPIHLLPFSAQQCYLFPFFCLRFVREISPRSTGLTMGFNQLVLSLLSLLCGSHALLLPTPPVARLARPAMCASHDVALTAERPKALAHAAALEAFAKKYEGFQEGRGAQQLLGKLQNAAS